ncbi:hypothetical protein N9K26_00925 [Flavobacteriales bacterium]|jgi:hypothetical protein|nr:hypothetical protein [Flavobacteriales bacterium]MDB4196071.1 hypothetical protein [Flavobacteriales bacterium]MDG1176366.1 hypothetical protein [Flavobacteriales bacterium]
MENKTLSRALFIVSTILFVITFFFFTGMVSNGAPDSYDPKQMGVELMDQGKASVATYKEEGQKAFEAQVKKIDSHILTGVNYMTIILIIAGGLMVVFLVYGLISTLMNNFKKGIPSLIFVGISILAFLWAFSNSGGDTTGYDGLITKFGQEEASNMISTTNFWVSGLLFVLIPGVIILIVDLVISIIRGFAK